MTGPLLLNVLVEPRGGAQILMAGHVRPGMTLQVDADLQVHLTRLWYQEDERDDWAWAQEPMTGGNQKSF